jgi:hypothetical protein
LRDFNPAYVGSGSKTPHPAAAHSPPMSAASPIPDAGADAQPDPSAPPVVPNARSNEPQSRPGIGSVSFGHCGPLDIAHACRQPRHRERTPQAGQILEFITAIPLMMPGPVMAVAMLWAYVRPPFMLYGTLWILLVAM